MSVYIDELENMTLYRRPFYAPIVEENKKHGSAIMLLTPDLASSKKLMNYPFMINNGLFESYYIEKDITYFINQENCLVRKFDEMFIHEGKLSTKKRDRLDDSSFGLPKERKYPLNDENHVKAAIKMFSYCPENRKKQLARNIKRKADEYGVEIGSDSKVAQYIKEYKEYGLGERYFDYDQMSELACDKFTDYIESIVSESQDIEDFKQIDYKKNAKEYLKDKTFLKDVPIEKTNGLLFVDYSDDSQYIGHISTYNGEVVSIGCWTGRKDLLNDLEYHAKNKGLTKSNIQESNNEYNQKSNFILNENDIYVNFDKFESGEDNTIFVIGFSGSGKSTLAKKLAEKYKAKYVELDKFDSSGEFPEDTLKNDNPILFKYLTTVYKKDRKTINDLSDEEFKKEFYKYIDWLKSQKDSKYIIEGVQLPEYIMRHSDMDSRPIIFKGTSLLMSMIRRFKRDGLKYEKTPSDIIKLAMNYKIWKSKLDTARELTVKKDNHKEIKEDFQLNGKTIIGKQKEYDYYKKHKDYHDKIVIDYKACGDKWQTINKFNLEEEDFESILNLHDEYSDYFDEVTEYKGEFLHSQDQYKMDDTCLRVHHENTNCVIYFNDILDEQVLNESSNPNSKLLRRLLYDERIRNNKEAFLLYDDIKKDIPWITKTYIDYKYYNKLNLFIDWSYYTQTFFKNNIYKLDKGIDLYFDFVNRFLDDKRLELNGYTKKTIMIPVLDWIPKDENIEAWDYTQTLNPISVIYRLMKTNPEKLRQKWSQYQFLFISDTGYFKVDFSKFEMKHLGQFIAFIRNFISKAPVLDDTTKESPKAIVTKIVNDIEQSQGITINNLTGGTDKLTPEEVKNKLDQGMSTSNSDEKKAQLVQIVKQNAEKSNNADDTIDTMDNEIDSGYVKQILMDLEAEEDNAVKINKARASRMVELNNKFLEKQIDGTTIKDMIRSSKAETELVKTALPVDNINEGWKEMTFMNFEDAYNLNDDIMSAMYSFSEKSVPISVRDIKIEDHSTSEDHIDTYIVECEDVYGQRFTLKFDVPKIKNKKFMKLRGNDKTLSAQLMLLPIIKTDEDTVQIVSNYNKIFVRRYGTNTGKSYVVADRLIKTLDKIEDKDIVITPGDNTRICSKYELPIDYIDLASIYSKIEIKGSCTIYFNQDELREKYKVNDSEGIPIGVYKYKDEVIYCGGAVQTASELILSLCTNRRVGNTIEYNDKFSQAYESTSTASKYTYSKASILNTEIPVIVIMGYNEGLQSALKKANIKYEIKDKREKFNKSSQDIIKFNDGYLYYELNYNSSLLMNGLKECNTEDYSIKDINNKSMWIEFLDIFGGRIKADGLDNFYDCMIDENTKDICVKYKLPTDYIEILAYANMLLADNKYNRHIDVTGNRYRKNEIIAGYVYKVLADAYGDYRNQLKRNRKGTTMSVKQSAVVDAVLLDPTSSDFSFLNPLSEYESGNSVSFKGLSGMNSDRSYGLDKRTFDSSMINLLAMSTGFAANVGLTRQATIDMNIEGKRGYIKATNNTDNMSVTKTLCMTEALTPFGSNHDDTFRSAMTFIQTSKHTMRTKKAMPCLVTNGADEAIAYLTSDTFAHKAKGTGKVVEKTDDYMVVEYRMSSGNVTSTPVKEFIDLREQVKKNSDGGFYITVKLDTDLKKGSTFKTNDILAYDKLSYSNAIGSSENIAYNIGTLTKVAIMNTDEGFEDSTIISEYLSDAMTSDVVVKKEYVFPKNTNIYNMVKKGQHIQEGDPLIIFQNAFEEEDANLLLKNITDDEDLISELGRIHVKSKITGVVQDIKIYRTVEKDELSDSLRSKVNEYEKEVKALKKIVDKNKPSNTVELEPDYKLEPIGKLKNAQDSVLIEFYLKYEDKMGVGDKLVYYSALKGVAKDIFPKGKEPYTNFRPGEKVHSLLAISSVNARMVASVKKVGALNKTIIELDRAVKDIMGVKWKNLDEM